MPEHTSISVTENYYAWQARGPLSRRLHSTPGPSKLPIEKKTTQARQAVGRLDRLPCFKKTIQVPEVLCDTTLRATSFAVGKAPSVGSKQARQALSGRPAAPHARRGVGRRDTSPTIKATDEPHGRQQRQAQSNETTCSNRHELVETVVYLAHRRSCRP